MDPRQATCLTLNFFLRASRATVGRSLAASLLLTVVSCSTTGSQLSQPTPAATTQPATAQAALASHLNQTQSKMYATYWCPYCQKQQALFGDAAKQLPIIECDPQGENARPDLCASAKISGYPTWEIQGQLYPGFLSLEELADRSGYQGSRDFGS